MITLLLCARLPGLRYSLAPRGGGSLLRREMQGGEAQPVRDVGVGVLAEQAADGVNVIGQRGVVQGVRPCLSRPAMSGCLIVGLLDKFAVDEGRSGRGPRPGAAVHDRAARRPGGGWAASRPPW